MAVSLIVSKLLGATYRIPLTNILGGEGMGLYQMVFPLYTFLLTLSSGGFPTAIARTVSVRLAAGDEPGAKRVLCVCLAVLLPIGLVGTLALLLLSRVLAALQGNPSATLAYVGIAPAVVAVAALSCYRGYYQGRENMLPTALSQLIEQGGKLLLGLTLASALAKRGVEYGVLGALCGVSASELLAVAVLVALHAHGVRRGRIKGAVAADFAGDMTAELGAFPEARRREGNELRTRAARGSRELLKSVFKVALPVTFGSLVLPLTQVIDSVLIINVLTATGRSAADATMAYGLVSGTVMTIVNMPAVVISAFSVALLPKIARSSQSAEEVARETSLGLRICLALGLVMLLFIFTYSETVIDILYGRGLTAYQLRLACRLLRINSLAVLYVSVVQVCTAVLQGLNSSGTPALNLAIGGAVKLAVTAAALPLIGIYGAAAGSVACYAVTAVLDVLSVKKRVGFGLDKARLCVLPIGGALFVVIAFLVSTLINGFPGIVLSALSAVVLYIVAVLGLGWLDAEERHVLFPFFKGKADKKGKNC